MPYMYGGEWCSDWRAANWAYRRSSRIDRKERTQIHADKEALITRLRAIDHQQMRLAEQRREIVGELERLRTMLYPPIIGFRPRRPPLHDEPPLPPTVADPRRLAGHDLRSVIRSLLHRHGRLTLRELHRQIHLAGYELAHRHPVKALADAVRYETVKGRLRRVARGIYEAVMRRQPQPQPGDPVLWADNDLWRDPRPQDPPPATGWDPPRSTATMGDRADGQ